MKLVLDSAISRVQCVEQVLLFRIMWNMQAIAHLADHRIAHADFKLDNIVVGQDGRLVLCDFGSAVLTASAAMAHAFRRGLSPGGNVQHLAPEVLNGVASAALCDEEVIIPYAKQDVWAAGTLLYELALGRHPLPDYPSGLEKNSVIDYDANVLPALPVSYPDVFRRLMQWMVHPVPEQRLTARAAARKVASLGAGDRDILLADAVTGKGRRAVDLLEERLESTVHEDYLRRSVAGTEEEGKTTEASESAEPADLGAAGAHLLDVNVKSPSGLAAVVRVPTNSTVLDVVKRAMDVLDINEYVKRFV